MKNILEYLECSAGRWPEKTACADTDTSMTWRMLREADRQFIADASDDPSAGGCLYGENTGLSGSDAWYCLWR